MARAEKIFWAMFIWIFGFGGPSFALAANQILNIRHWVAPDHTRVVIDASEDCAFTVEKDRQGIAVDLEDTTIAPHIPALIPLNKPGVTHVAVSPLPPSGVRVSLSIPTQAQTTVFKLRKIQDQPFRIVVDIVLPEVVRQESEARERVKITRKDRIVVIDPGHGGDAPGAVGRRGTLEKDVVLSIARKLREILNGREGYRAFLTRDDDYYVSFNKRVQIAREYGAHLFVSIHADAARNRQVGGSSVYSLSMGGASSEAARILAQDENLADVVGGVPNGEGSDDSNPIILDMFQNHTLNQSKTFGNALLKYLEGANPLKFTTVQEAPFRVLKLPEIPSVLIETAYISNEKEERLLRNGAFRSRIAEAIAKAVVEFIPPLPLFAELVSERKKAPKPSGRSEDDFKEKRTEEKVGAAEKDGIETTGKGTSETREGEVRYRVRKGDTLGKIAVRHGTAIGTLLKLNDMKLTDRLLAGRLLKVRGATTAKKEEAENQPGRLKDPPAAISKKTVYRVKRGDSLGAIAAKHGTTIRVLMKLNDLKRPDPLYIGRKLVLPGT